MIIFIDMSKKFLTYGIVLLVVAVVTAISVLFIYSYETRQSPKVDYTGWTQQGVQEVVNANNQFALELYSKLSTDGNKNIFYSPFSISSALAMVYEGAKGQTANEIKSVFHFPENSMLRPNFAKIYNNINEANKTYELKTGNALWVQQNYPLLKSYLNIVKKYYGGKVANLDFVKETEKSRQTINSFIEKQTDNNIKDLIPQGDLDPNTKLVLTNAIYFKGMWKWEFDKSQTQEQYFKITPTNSIKVPMMNMEPNKAEFNYANLKNLQILELPYKGNKISMLILLPTKNLASLYPLTLKKLTGWKNQMQKTELILISLPKFELDTKYFMNKTLSAMGMPIAFSPGADFSGMTGEKGLDISSVIHQAHIKVDEKGTEASAATTVGMHTNLVSSGPVFNADHPFIFIIQEKKTGNILFMGRIIDPTK